MNQEALQRIWDDCLIRSWLTDANKAHLVQQFLLRIPHEIDTNNAEEITNLMLSLKLKRCRDKAADGSFTFHLSKVPVRAFIEDRSKTLSSWLWSGKYTPEQMVDGIYTAKWTRLGKASINSSRNTRTKARRDRASTKVVKARELSPQWDDIK